MKGVLTVNPESKYDDRVSETYHFKARADYLQYAKAMVGDWVIFRESRRGGGRFGYVGAARVKSIDEDGADVYVRVADYFEFSPILRLKDSKGEYREALLRAVPSPGLIGRELEGKSVRPLSDADFAGIVADALSETLREENLIKYGPAAHDGLDIGTASDQPLSDDVFVRRVVSTLINRKVRDTNFRRLVCKAYDDTCAISGLRIINGGGRSEVQAAHIWSVEDGGPDTIHNGLALSGTVHWLFDRHLISLTDNYELLVAHNRVPEALRGLFTQQMSRIKLPTNEQLWPSKAYIARHRERYASH